MQDPDPHSPTDARLAAKLTSGAVSARLLALGLTLVAAAGAGYLLTPGNYIERLPGDDALAMLAVRTVRAARDYQILDEKETQRRREEARKAQPPVFDYADTAADEAAVRITGAFQLMRQGTPAAAPVAAPLPESHRADRARLHAYYVSQRAEFQNRLQISELRDEAFAALEENRFSEDAEKQLLLLAAHGLDKVVADQDDPMVERDRGLIARPPRGGEIEIEDLRLVRTLKQARDDVARFGASLPQSVSPRLRSALIHIAMAELHPTLVRNREEAARRAQQRVDAVAPVILSIKRGETVVNEGQRLEERHLLVFRGIREQTGPMDLLSARLGGAVLALLLILLLWGYARRNVAAFRPARKDALLLALLYLGTLGLSTVGLGVGDALHNSFPSLPAESFYYLVPFAAGAMLVRSVLSAEMALLFSVASGASVGLLAGQSIFFALHAVLTSVAACGMASRTRSRRGLFRAGLGVGGLGALLVVAGFLFTGRASGDFAGLGVRRLLPELARELGAPAGAALASGAVFLPILVLLGLPVIETAFGYVTDVKLLELANLNHPALKELIVQAPGTYHHSIIMGSLVEAAATAIRANPLLARVSAYYHDIGKIRNPLYFAENQRGENKHEQLAPSMSALIVKRHVTDGLELAAHWRLPRVVADAIPQHHGTRFVSYFWAKAQKAAEGDRAAGRAPLPRGEEGPDEGLYRYAGPKPQTKETALVMIADACEASARALAEPTGDRLQTLVQKRINEIFSEGQLDDCELTLKDLNAIAAAMVGALESIYHSRPEYPGRPPSDKERPTPVSLATAKGQG